MGLAAEAGQTMGDLTATMSDASQAAHQITASTQEQKVGIDQIAQAMGDISQTTSQFVAGVEESQSAAEDLHGLAQGLQALTEKYRV
jgi:methyl-accepting chemotaxis protein